MDILEKMWCSSGKLDFNRKEGEIFFINLLILFPYTLDLLLHIFTTIANLFLKIIRKRMLFDVKYKKQTEGESTYCSQLNLFRIRRKKSIKLTIHTSTLIKHLLN